MAKYNARKASAQTLLNEISASLPTMQQDHSKWNASLDEAWKKARVDTSKIHYVRSDIKKHEGDMATIISLVDSVKSYMGATPEQGNAFINADDRLRVNFDALNNRWKSFQDTHMGLQQSVQQLVIKVAGNAADIATARHRMSSNTKK